MSSKTRVNIGVQFSRAQLAELDRVIAQVTPKGEPLNRSAFIRELVRERCAMGPRAVADAFVDGVIKGLAG